MRIFQTTDPEYLSLQKEDFKLHTREEEIHDAKFETKPVGFFKDAMPVSYTHLRAHETL